MEGGNPKCMMGDYQKVPNWGRLLIMKGDGH